MGRKGIRYGLRNGVLALCLSFGATLGVTSPAPAEVVNLTPDEALLTAREAYRVGNYAVANHLARALLLALPDDPRVHLLLAVTEPKMGRAEAGLKAGRKAWQLGRNGAAPDELRYEIARNTAKAALDANRPMLAQFWLRKSIDVAPDEALKQASGRDLGFVRNRTPWRLNFDMEAGPSDNLNGGADSSVFQIGGVVFGNLSNGAEALSGSVASFRLRAERALPGSDRAQTVLSFSADTVRNRIDTASRAAAGTVTSRDLDRSRLSFGLRRDMAVGDKAKPLSLSAEVGHSWAGGEPVGPSLTLAAQGALARGEAGTLWLLGSVERSWDGGNPSGSDLFALTLTGQRALGPKGQMSLGVTVEGARSGFANSTYDAARLALQVDPGWQLGGVGIRFGANASLRDYERFLLIGNSVAVRGGRQDRSVGLSMDLSFDNLGVMGFAPVLSLRHSDTKSNVSRYETKTTGISIGISSVF